MLCNCSLLYVWTLHVHDCTYKLYACAYSNWSVKDGLCNHAQNTSENFFFFTSSKHRSSSNLEHSIKRTYMRSCWNNKKILKEKVEHDGQRRTESTSQELFNLPLLFDELVKQCRRRCTWAGQHFIKHFSVTTQSAMLAIAIISLQMLLYKSTPS